MSDNFDQDVDSRPSTPESYQTGEGGSLPPSPGGRERAELRRRAQSHDASLFNRCMGPADLFSSGSGVVDPASSAEGQGELGPHKPFGLMTVNEAWQTLATRQRLWFPIPISWKDNPQLRGAAIFFNKYPNVYDESEKPDVTKIFAVEPSIGKDADITQCRMNVRKIGPALLETVRRSRAPDDVGPNDTTARISVEEVPPVNPFPSHLLVIDQYPPIRGQRHRTFVAVHDVVILCFIARINVPPRIDPKPVTKGDKIEITVPIVRLAIPNPRIFDRIVSYMYSAYKQPDLLAFFDLHLGYCGLPEAARIQAGKSLPRLIQIPFMKPDELAIWGDWAKQTEGFIATHLSMTYCYERLLDLMRDANLQFENCKALSMYDNLFEAGLLLCRRMLLSAMTLSVVRDHLV